MDVSLINTTPYSIPRSGDYSEMQAGRMAAGKNPEMPLPFNTGSKVSDEVREQFIMSLQDVQNFLYMMIGSKIRVQSDNNTPGSTVDTAA